MSPYVLTPLSKHVVETNRRGGRFRQTLKLGGAVLFLCVNKALPPTPPSLCPSQTYFVATPFNKSVFYYFLRELRSKNRHKTFICLCVTLVGLYASFMVMATLELRQNHNRVGGRIGEIPCTCLAASVHFFILSSIAWMGVEGVIIYLLFVKVFHTYIHCFVWKAASFAWGKFHLLSFQFKSGMKP